MKVNKKIGETVYAVYYDIDRLANVLEVEYLGSRNMSDNFMVRLPNGELLEVGLIYDSIDDALNQAMKYNSVTARQYKTQLENQKKDIEQLSTHMAQTMIRIGKIEGLPIIKWLLNITK